MKYINLEKSFAFLNSHEDYIIDNSTRVSIKSLLINLTDNKKYYLTKETRAVITGQYPFTHPAKSELCIIIEDKNLKYHIRNNPVLKKNDFDSHHYSIHSLKKPRMKLF
jgi:hypothetical protein|tara:strand:+ start:595 stop:921 length:327 start_codon:yes stop_codon:yes gene_type:complete